MQQTLACGNVVKGKLILCKSYEQTRFPNCTVADGQGGKINVSTHDPNPITHTRASKLYFYFAKSSLARNSPDANKFKLFHKLPPISAIHVVTQVLF